ncbi:hypothetical protein HUJ05_002181 [Dendroctonus ponderosae]|nr:hypothetical protein HUJ05_002181 [Dendroctonus ponderosae]
MSHHQVEKADSTTSRTRVVFNASMQTSSGLSLNHVLKVGPVVQRDLFSILPRFRKHKFVLIGDLEKMYRQILVRPEDRGLQCIVWRDNPNSPMQHYTLNNITYGTASASFLATRCLLEIARDKESKHPLESEIIQNDFYVDDLLTGYNNIDQLIVIRKNLTNIFAEYGFRLRKFQSNSSSVLQDLQDNIGNADYTVSGETIKKLSVSRGMLNPIVLPIKQLAVEKIRSVLPRESQRGRESRISKGLFETTNQPKRVFNANESAFYLNPKGSKVLAKKGDKNIYCVGGDQKENLTVLLTANADGQIPPPMTKVIVDSETSEVKWENSGGSPPPLLKTVEVVL